MKVRLHREWLKLYTPDSSRLWLNDALLRAGLTEIDHSTSSVLPVYTVDRMPDDAPLFGIKWIEVNDKGVPIK